jgi:hypothetical protein
VGEKMTSSLTSSHPTPPPPLRTRSP